MLHCSESTRGGGDISALSGQWVTWGALLGGPSSYVHAQDHHDHHDHLLGGPSSYVRAQDHHDLIYDHDSLANKIQNVRITLQNSE